MKLKLAVTRGKVSICQGIYDVSDAESFGAACSNLWEKMDQRKVAAAKNIGALYDSLEDSKADELRGLRIELEPLDKP